MAMSEWCTGALPLAIYAQHYIGSECGLWGVSNPDEPNNFIWTLFQRQELARALCEAQEEMEEVMQYFLEPKWLTDEPHDCSPTGTYLMKWNHVIAGGIKTSDSIKSGATVDHTADPAVIGPHATAATDTKEIKIYYPGETQEITPSDISISGGFVTIAIPRCRLVKTDLVDNPEEGLLYSTLANFLTTVDVHRVYNDTSDQGEFVVRTIGECDPETLTLCIDIRDAEISEVLAYLVSTATTCRTATTDQARFNYVSGIPELNRIAELALVRLAHSKMPGEPCEYDRIKEMWRRDNTIPQILSVERLECPFGLSNGAWMSWKFAGSIAVDRMSVM